MDISITDHRYIRHIEGYISYDNQVLVACSVQECQLLALRCLNCLLLFLELMMVESICPKPIRSGYNPTKYHTEGLMED